MITIDTTKSDCMIELDVSYGRYGSQRLSKAITEKEQYLGRRMTREEILHLYHEIDEQLCRTVMTRAGK
jgi:hypothetical protein